MGYRLISGFVDEPHNEKAIVVLDDHEPEIMYRVRQLNGSFQILSTRKLNYHEAGAVSRNQELLFEKVLDQDKLKSLLEHHRQVRRSSK